MINVTNEPTKKKERKKSHKEEIMEEITEKLMERYWAQLTRRYKVHSRNFKTPRIQEDTDTNK
jgi:hypothetical protein